MSSDRGVSELVWFSRSFRLSVDTRDIAAWSDGTSYRVDQIDFSGQLVDSHLQLGNGTTQRTNYASQMELGLRWLRPHLASGEIDPDNLLSIKNGQVYDPVTMRTVSGNQGFLPQAEGVYDHVMRGATGITSWVTAGYSDGWQRSWFGEEFADKYQNGAAYTASKYLFGAATIVASFGAGSIFGEGRAAYAAAQGCLAHRLGQGFTAMTVAAGSARNAVAAVAFTGWMVGTDVVTVWQSGYNVVHGKFSATDLLGFAPSVGWAMGAVRGLRRGWSSGIASIEDAIDAGFAPGYQQGLANRGLRKAFKEEMRKLGFSVEWTTSGGSRFQRGTATINKITATPGTLLDEYTHAFNRVHGKGKYLPDGLASVHQELWEDVKRLGSTSRLTLPENTLYHQLELLNFLRSGNRMPSFMRVIPTQELTDFLSIPIRSDVILGPWP